MKQLIIILAALALCLDALTATRSGLEPARFDTIIDGKSTALYAIRNKHGMEACVTNYGARLVSLLYQGKDVTLGFDNISDYHRHKQNFGATVGRYVGRINHARFTLDGTTYQLQENGKGNTSHGGHPGFADRVWTVTARTDSTLTLQYRSEDGENGFPGSLIVELTYALTDRDALELTYVATTDKPTVVNLTNHSFFNLSGDAACDVLCEWLYVDSRKIATFDEGKNLNGKFMKVKGTPFDFRAFRQIGERIDDDNPQLRVTGGYDHSFALRNKQSLGRPVAVIADDTSGITMRVYTTEPALHIYTANGLKGNLIGKDGTAYARRTAVCFETMHFADSPNQPQFPSTVLRPGEEYRSKTIYEFGSVTTNKSAKASRNCTQGPARAQFAR